MKVENNERAKERKEKSVNQKDLAKTSVMDKWRGRAKTVEFWNGQERLFFLPLMADGEESGGGKGFIWGQLSQQIQKGKLFGICVAVCGGREAKVEETVN